jgi:hypothetical protein
MTLAVQNESYPTPDEIRGQILSDIRWSYHQAGLTANVAKGSELYYRAQAFANRLSIAIANNQIVVARFSPLTATGDDLAAMCSLYGITARSASFAAGLVRYTTTPTTLSVTIPASFKATSGDGVQYSVTVAVTGPSGSYVEIQSVEAGELGNLDSGDILTWDSAAIGGLARTCTVSAGGITGGAAADDDEALRERLLRRLQFPAVGGNPSQVIGWSEDASAAVSAAFVYSAARGPGSYDVCVVTNDDPTRLLGASVTSSVAAGIIAEMPGWSDLLVTSIVAQSTMIVIDLDLPLPIASGGAGGGWRDAVPWPSDAETATHVRAEVTTVTPATRQIIVNSTATNVPAAGNRIAIWNPTGGDDGFGEFAEFTITAVGGGAGAYSLTLDATVDAFSNITRGMFVSPGAYNIKLYGKILRDAIMALGPGEKTDSADRLPRAARNPSPDVSYPADLASPLLASLSTAYPEVRDASFAECFLHGTGATGTSAYTPSYTPDVPAVVTSAPRIITISCLAFRRKT